MSLTNQSFHAWVGKAQRDEGATYRQWLAGIIMGGFAADPEAMMTATDASTLAIEWADALITKLEEKQP